MDSVQQTRNFSEIIRPKNVFEEVTKIISLIFPDFNYDLLSNSYRDIIRLFNGKYFGYQKCDTKYHDLSHTEDCLLEMARLIHGSSLNDHSFCEKDVNLGLISAIVHDTGYIKANKDVRGTGGKFTIIHISRSIKFMNEYLSQKEFSSMDIHFCENCLKCTGIFVKIDTI